MEWLWLDQGAPSNFRRTSKDDEIFKLSVNPVVSASALVDTVYVTLEMNSQ